MAKARALPTKLLWLLGALLLADGAPKEPNREDPAEPCSAEADLEAFTAHVDLSLCGDPETPVCVFDDEETSIGREQKLFEKVFACGGRVVFQWKKCRVCLRATDRCVRISQPALPRLATCTKRRPDPMVE